MRKTLSQKGRGFTIVELLVVVSIIALLIAILLPAIGKARDAALTTQSLANLRNLSAANSSYGADWSDRQFTAIPDDAGLVGGSCTSYITNVACPPQQLLGWAVNAANQQVMWGYFLGNQGLCAPYGYPPQSNCGNWVTYKAIEFSGGSAGFGAFRLPNVKAFAGYVNNKFYDPVFWAPKDKINLAIAEKYFSLPYQFDSSANEIAFSTYCWSPAAMLAPDVLSKDGYKSAESQAGGFRSPAVGMATYPDLKTRMIEHSWLQNAESAVNPNIEGEPWYFNHGYNSAPATLFFDGHVAIMGVGDAMESDARAKKLAPASQNQKGLWHTGVPGFPNYFQDDAYDFIVKTSYHILTTDGIQGRDTIGAK